MFSVFSCIIGICGDVDDCCSLIFYMLVHTAETSTELVAR